MTTFKTKFSLGEQVVFFQRSITTKKFMSAIPGIIREITFYKDGETRFKSDNWHGIKESELTTYKNAPKRLIEELKESEDLTGEKK